jgi:uncharacterized protein involved in response to NO
MAGLMMGISAVWWAVMIVAHAKGTPIPWAISPLPAHGLLMSMGFIPMFFIGFLFTAGPKWLRMPEQEARPLLPALLLMLVGWLAAMVGFHALAALTCAGLVLVAAGWTVLSLKFTRLVVQSEAPDRMHARWVATACWIGVLALWTSAVATGTGADTLLRAATQVGIWAFVATVFTVVSHRMIPYFGSAAVPLLDAWRPQWLLWVMIAVLWLQAIMNVLELWSLPMSTALRWWQVAIELPAALLLLWVAFRWGLIKARRIRLVAMLHAGFTWLGISFALYAISHTMMAMSDGAQSLGLAPLHALTMGYLGATMFAMTTRVSTGHGGRAVTADNWAWAFYWILQIAALFRVIAAIWIAQAGPMMLLAITAWTLAVLAWGFRYGRWFGRPRADGRPG